MDVFIANEQDLPADLGRLSALARHALQAEDVEDDVELSVLLVTTAHMQKLNARFAGNDYATDVLAFPMAEDDEDEDENMVLGDIVMCPPVAERHAVRSGHGLQRELETLLVHGTLHLLGYDHQSDDQRTRMDSRTREIIRSFGPVSA